MASPSIVLFTRDLRAHDHPALVAAAEAGPVVPLFVHDDGVDGFRAPNRGRFLAECLTDLDENLRAGGAALVHRRGRVVEEVRALAREVAAGSVHVAGDVSAYAGRRREALEAALGQDGRELVVHDRVVTVVAPGAVTPSGGGDHFRVFTPYHRKWEEQPRRRPLDPPRLRSVDVDPGSAPAAPEATAPDLATGGEGAARERWEAWDVEGYGRGQDRPAHDATSRLSPYLHFGCLSPTELVATTPDTDAGRQFVRQLAWRDFHHQTLAARPDAARHDYRDRGDRWRSSDEELAAWAEGRTGVPIVDAGMRQLQHEGWMHNRVRLITGSFLVKSLYLDWRAGAEHFLHHLVDGDVANNQMNWQWVAGTGTDTRPNRVLNPLAQARRYDPDGAYVRRWIPELAAFDGRAAHEPWRHGGTDAHPGYPAPIVDLDELGATFRRARGA